MQSELGEFHLISWEVWQAHKVLCNLAHQQSILFLLQNTYLYFLQFDVERLHCHNYRIVTVYLEWYSEQSCLLSECQI